MTSAPGRPVAMAHPDAGGGAPAQRRRPLQSPMLWLEDGRCLPPARRRWPAPRQRPPAGGQPPSPGRGALVRRHTASRRASVAALPRLRRRAAGARLVAVEPAPEDDRRCWRGCARVAYAEEDTPVSRELPAHYLLEQWRYRSSTLRHTGYTTGMRTC